MESWITLVDDIEIGKRLAVFPPLQIHKTEIVLRVEVVGVNFQHALQVGCRAVKVFHLIAEQGAVEERRRVVRLQFERVVVVGHRTEIIVEIIADESPVQIIVGFTRFKADCFVHVAESTLPVLLFYLDVGTQQIWLQRGG